MGTFSALTFSPMVSWSIIGAILAVAVALSAFGLLRHARGPVLRLIPVAALCLYLSGPQLVSETREPLSDVVVVIADESSSQRFTGRSQQTADSLAGLTERLSRFPDLETRIVRVTESGNTGTRFATAVDGALKDVPPDRRAGVILLTDGQVHDADRIADQLTPVHLVLTGKRTDFDRVIVVRAAPRFGLVGSTALAKIVVEDATVDPGTPIPVTVRRAGKPDETLALPANEEVTLPIDLEQAGSNVVEISTDPQPGEVSITNNRAALDISGVRDRLRVLLISGQPHVGERVWRNSLKSDPAIDLIHFTILRSMYSDDPTPTYELSLIAFPIQELFEDKLANFDLIIFDRFERWGLVPEIYLRNVVSAVREGGAVLVSVGPEFDRPGGLAGSVLSEIIPAQPTGRLNDAPFVPRLTPDGQRHPVTAPLQRPNAGSGGAAWGPWLRQVEVRSPRGRVLMEGPDARPLLILSEEGKGRAALITSDTFWLWAKGWQGGGPQSELLRRTMHWLMREPDLEAESLRAQVTNAQLLITRRSLEAFTPSIMVTGPDGVETEHSIRSDEPGLGRLETAAPLPGLYRIRTPDGLEALAVSGASNPLETTHVLATDTLLSPLVKSTGGSVVWLNDDGIPELRRTSPRQVAHGRGWIGLKANGAHVVSSVRLIPLFSVWVALAVTLGFLGLSWFREGARQPSSSLLRKNFTREG